MRYHVFATDYDGTLAKDERVSPKVMESLKKLKDSGRKLILVTGRELKDLQRVFPEHGIFDRIVAENGATIYCPVTQKERTLGEPPPKVLINKLKKLNIKPLSVGRVIIATWEPHQTAVLNAIKETGLEYQVIFNKGAVMILPPGINKAKGLKEALNELGISEHNTLVVGDAENDNAMLQVAECAVAVANALPQVKAAADWTTKKRQGDGVKEIIDHLLLDDLLGLNLNVGRHDLMMGTLSDGASFHIRPYDNNFLVAGTSGAGKTTFIAALLEKMVVRQYQYCLIDPEGDYLELPNVLSIGDSSQPPLIDRVIKLLKQPLQNAVVCILAIPHHERPSFLKKLLGKVKAMRISVGHPHFIVLDEAHHLIPANIGESYFNFREDFVNVFAVTTKPELVSTRFLKQINTVMIMGEHPEHSMGAFATLTGCTIETTKNGSILEKGEALIWRKEEGSTVMVKYNMPDQLLQRHKRKYADGDMGWNSFYFNGPNNKANLKANSLMSFIKMGKVIDNETWLYHLRQKDYSNWFRTSVNDEDLAIHTEHVEENEQNSDSSRSAIFDLIHERYTV